MLNKYLDSLYAKTVIINDDNVCRALREHGPFDSLLDVGCWDGEKTLAYAQASKATRILGIEAVAAKAEEAKARGVQAASLLADSEKWPFEDKTIDCIVSNQVIEHLSNVDHFLSEAERVLKPKGIIVTSTNNLSSWHNIISLVFGWAPFDLTNSSKRVLGVGNPLAIHRGETMPNGSTWTHKTIYTTHWLNEWLAVYGFRPVKHYGAGYHPLPAGLGRLLKKHCALITLVNQKTPARR